MTDEPVKRSIFFMMVHSSMNLEALNCSVIAGIMKKNPDVNLVSAPFIAKERIQISTTNQDKSGAFDGYIKVTVVTAKTRALNRGNRL